MKKEVAEIETPRPRKGRGVFWVQRVKKISGGVAEAGQLDHVGVIADGTG